MFVHVTPSAPPVDIPVDGGKKIRNCGLVRRKPLGHSEHTILDLWPDIKQINTENYKVQ